LLSELTFASFLVYSPRGTSALSQRSQQVVLTLKANRLLSMPPEPAATYLARRMAELLPGGDVAELLAGDAVLVPVPRSSVTGGRPRPWPASDIATAMVQRGFGRSVLACLRRSRAVTKAAWAGSGQRPMAADHRASLAVSGDVRLPPEVVLVDDVVTSGAQLLGAAWALHDIRSDARVSGFAAVRTMSDGDVSNLVQPVVGTITLHGDLTRRRP
jgi:hypothetical protein